MLVIGVIPVQKASAAKRFDLWGQVTAIVSLSSITYVVIAWGEHGWDVTYIAWIISGIILTACFFTIESTTPDPMLPLALFREETFSIAAFVGFCLNFSFFGQLAGHHGCQDWP